MPKSAPHLGLFFEHEGVEAETRSPLYSNNALLYRDVLNYQDIIGENQEFRFNDLAKWLIENNREFLDYYMGDKARITTSYRIASRRQRIQGVVDDFLKMRLLQTQRTVKASRNDNLETPLYSFTVGGRLMSLLVRLESMDQANEAKRIENIVDEIYELVINSILKLNQLVDRSLSFEELQKNRSSLILLLERIFVNLKEANLFGGFITHMLSEIYSSSLLADPEDEGSTFYDVHSIFYYLLDIKKAKIVKQSGLPFEGFWKIWLESFSELEKNTQEIILLRYKNGLEQNSGIDYHHRGYEEAKLRSCGDVHNVVCEIHCENCVGSFTLMPTLEAVRARFLGGYTTHIDCKTCGKPAYYYFPTV